MIFDANIALGRSGKNRGRYFSDAEELLKAMDFFGISGALVYSVLAKEVDCQAGNLQLQESLAGQSRLFPCWVTVPGIEDPAELIAGMDKHDVRALRLFPESGHFSIRPWCVGALADLLEQNNKLLLIDFESPSWSCDGIDWEGIRQLCEAFPRLAVLICGVPPAGPSNYMNLIKKFDNLYIEISQLSCPGEISRLSGEGLEKQIVLGSDLPSRHAGSAINMLSNEDIPGYKQAKIKAGNIIDILKLIKELPEKAVSKVLGFDKIIDTHAHLGAWNHSMSGNGDAGSIVKEMDRCGIVSAVLTSLWACYGEVVRGNQAVAEACSKYPGRFYGYLTLDPKYPDEVAKEIMKYESNPGFKGIKLHCGTHAYDFTGDEYHFILEYADLKKLPVLIHGSFITDIWHKICRKYTGAKFIIAHLGGCGFDMPSAIELAKCCRQVDNLYFDMASSKAFYGFLEELIKLAGAEKVLFGSDHPIFDFGYELGQVIYSQVKPEDKKKILFENAKSVFGLVKG